MESALKYLTDFYNQPLFVIVGGIATTVTFFGLLYAISCWLFGITPVILRLGTALWKRKIAIFAEGEAFESLKGALLDSGLFKNKRIVHIKSDNTDKAKDETIFLVDWESFGSKIDQIFSLRKNHQTPIVIHAKPGIIPQEKMNDIANRANTVVTNFRGRLLNDILTSLVTTTYGR
jgi:hypothetical protein